MKAANVIALALAVSFAGGRFAIAGEDAGSTATPPTMTTASTIAFRLCGTRREKSAPITASLRCATLPARAGRSTNSPGCNVAAVTS
jgi:hypothetical protein